MSEVAVAETETSTPVSEIVAEAPSPVEVAVPDAPGTETPEPEVPAPEPEPAPRTPDSYSLQELDQLYREAKLTDPSLVERREGLRQREAERQREESRLLNERRQAEQQRINQLANLAAATKQGLRQAAEAEIEAALRVGRQPDMELITERMNLQLDRLVEQTRDIHLAPKEAALRQILSSAYPGANGRAYLDSLGLDDLIVQLHEVGKMMGRAEGAPADSVVKTKKEYDADIEAAEKRAYNTLKAANGGSAPPNPGARQQANVLHDFAWLHALPMDEYAAVPIEERRRIHNEEARRRAR